LLDTVLDALQAGRPFERLAVPIAAWILFLERQFRSGAEVVDPLADQLRLAAMGNDPVNAILSLRQVFPERLGAASDFGRLVARVRSAMLVTGAREFLRSEFVAA
jgi:fructuronate reductase